MYQSVELDWANFSRLKAIQTLFYQFANKSIDFTNCKVFMQGEVP